MSKRWFGWAGAILEVDLSAKTVVKRELPPDLAPGYLGQAGINARFLFDRTTRGMSPLDPAAPPHIRGRTTRRYHGPLFGAFHGHLEIAPYRHLRRRELWETLGTRTESRRPGTGYHTASGGRIGPGKPTATSCPVFISSGLHRGPGPAQAAAELLAPRPPPMWRKVCRYFSYCWNRNSKRPARYSALHPWVRGNNGSRVCGNIARSYRASL